MPVEITNTLSPETQAVADAREAVRKTAYHVEECKTELKTAKALWEEAVQRLNDAIDTMIDAQRQPTLFSRFKDDPPPAASPDDRSHAPDPPAPPAPETDPVAGEPAAGEGEILDAEYEVNPDTVPSLPAAAAEVPGWRKLYVADEFDSSHLVFDVLGEAGVETLGQLADALLAGQTFDLPADNVRELREGIQDASQEDDEPIRFGDAAPADGPLPVRGDYPDDKTGGWEHRIAVSKWADAGKTDDLSKKHAADMAAMAEQIQGYRARQAVGTAASGWGKWSEFDVSVTAGGKEHVVRVLYQPDWKQDPTRDHVEAWGPITATGYFSDVVTNAKGKRPKLPLAEWCREWAQRHADEFGKEQKRAKRDRKKEPAKKGA